VRALEKAHSSVRVKGKNGSLDQGSIGLSSGMLANHKQSIREDSGEANALLKKWAKKKLMQIEKKC